MSPSYNIRYCYSQCLSILVVITSYMRVGFSILNLKDSLKLVTALEDFVLTTGIARILHGPHGYDK
jgi:hypothetical protein